MDIESLTALIAACTGLATAAGTLIGLIRHVTGPAHQDPPAPPEPAPGTLAGKPAGTAKP